ncbi:MAG TPA: outer membrane beta-barrel protein [Clostridia bacterium]|nr:outer membrane beta-barrel protein [Clostridia bacterium]
MKSCRLALVAAALALACPNAPAQGRETPYITVDAGAAWVQSMEIQQLNSPFFPRSSEIEFDPGFRLDAGFGYLLREGAVVGYKRAKAVFDIAVELDAGFIYNEAKSIGGSDLDGTGTTLDLYQIPLMANAIFSFPITERLRVSTGGGVGGVVMLMHADSLASSASTEEELVFGYQALANVSYGFTDNFSAGLSYRFLGTSNAEFGGDLQFSGDSVMTHFLGLSFTWVF